MSDSFCTWLTRLHITMGAAGLLKVPLGRKFIGLFQPNSVGEYRVLFVFPQKTEQQTFHPNILSSKIAQNVSAITENVFLGDCAI